MNVVAVIPARGGSKGIPRKNLALVAGRPLLSYAVAAACEARCVGRVIVSTDDPEIAVVARKAGAEAIDRPAELAGDAAPSESAVLHALEWLQAGEGFTPELVILLQCTSPLTRGEDIDRAISRLMTEGADCVFSASRFHRFIWEADDGCAKGINHDPAVRKRRQERETQFLENGAIYVMRTSGLLRVRHRFFGKIAVYEMPANRTLEIDEPHDLEVADMLLRTLNQGHR